MGYIIGGFPTKGDALGIQRGYTSFLKGLVGITQVIPQKTVAQVSMKGRHRRGGSLSCMDGRANPLMDPKVVGVVLWGVVTAVTSPTTAGCSLVWCSCSSSVVQSSSRGPLL